MARDAALLTRAARTGESVFSVYSWERPTLSFGRNQRARGQYHRARIDEREMDVVRRPTGGRAILHHREITYSVTAPLTESESLRGAYERINLILLDGLLRLGVKASIATGGKAMKPGPIPCFELPSDGEITAAGRKLVGSAQWRGESAFLQHGSILVDDDQTSLASLASDDAEGPVVAPPAPATLRALLGRAPEPEELAAAMFDSVRERENVEGAALQEDEIRAAALDIVPDYLDDAWTWRR
jgi:lipoate-protein ligase A